VVLVKVLEHVFEVLFILCYGTLQTACHKLIIIDHAILVSVDRVHYRLQLDKTGVLVLILKGLFKLLDCQQSITVGVDLFEEGTEFVNLLFRNLTCDIRHRKCLELRM
jgi:hypothetical protein